MHETVRILDKIFTPMISASRMAEAVREVASSINQQLADKCPLFIVVLNGSFVFAADLLREVSIDCEITFVRIGSYQGTASTGTASLLMDLREDVASRVVVLVEDIVDSGLTVTTLRKMLLDRGASQVMVATALFKPSSYREAQPIDFVGISIPDAFVVGYGLDYNGRGRNLKEIHVLAS